MKRIDTPFESPERLWKRPIEVHAGKPRLRVASSSYERPVACSTFDHETSTKKEVDRIPLPENIGLPTQEEDEILPQVKVQTEAGNAKVTVELGDIEKEKLTLNCAEDSLILSVKSSIGLRRKKIAFPFHVDPDTAKAAFKNGRLELVVRKHGRFNRLGPKLDGV